MLKNSSKEECVIELPSVESREKWRKLITERAESIDQLLKKDKFQFGNVQKYEAIILQEQFEQTHDDDPAGQEDPKQLQSSFQMDVDKMSIVIEGLTNFKLKSRTFDPSRQDEIMFTPKIP